jgi:hypothetical protein
MNPPKRKEIAKTQKDSILNGLPDIHQSEAYHTCWACYEGIGLPEFTPTRAHINSNQNGGSNNPSNYFLLCRNCHKEQPDGCSKHIQLLWLKRQPTHIEREIKFAHSIFDLIEDEADQLEDEKILNKYLKYLTREELVKEIINKASLRTSGPSNFKSNVKFEFLDHFKVWAILNYQR